ncbi:Uncharacterised protein [Chlamydia abortus]|nr:Uncharacterised protein [Chlamydia abortus]SGA33685.1 Uncharacterised protein [Chlamydia abortus]
MIYYQRKVFLLKNEAEKIYEYILLKNKNIQPIHIQDMKIQF